MAVHLNLAAIKRLEKAAAPTARQAVDMLREKVIKAQVMPCDLGDMQGTQTFSVLEKSGGVITARLVTGSPQACRLYFNPNKKDPPFNFQKRRNSNAGSHWLLPWLSGEHKGYLQNTFTEQYRKKAKL